MHKLRHYKKPNVVHKNMVLCKDHQLNLDKPVDLEEEEDTCLCFVSLDAIEVQEVGSTRNNLVKKDATDKNIILGDVRDHKVASECLPDQVTGYWIRVLGQKLKYTLKFSLWKNLKESSGQNCYKYPKRKFSDSKKLMRIGELSVNIVNTGYGQTVKKKKRKSKPSYSVSKRLIDKNIAAVDYAPSFCCKEKYIQIVTCFRECMENGNYDLFSEMLEKFKTGLSLENPNDKELQIFLDCEQSQFYTIQGKFPEAKKLLQKCVENVIPKSPNKVFLLNRAYLFLANAHILEGNIGTAEECLTILQYDKKNGMSFEDIGYLNLMFGILVMNFGISLPNLSNYLYQESEMYLKSAVTNFQKLPSLFNYLCRSHLNLARLFIFKSQRVSSELETKYWKYASQEIQEVECFGAEKLSTCVHCLMLVVKAELLYCQNQVEKGDKLLSDAELTARRFNFQEIITHCNSVKDWCNKRQYDDFLNSIEIPEGETFDFLSDSDGYYADDSCMGG